MKELYRIWWFTTF